MKRFQFIRPLISELADLVGLLLFFGVSSNSIITYIESAPKWVLFLALISFILLIRIFLGKINSLLNSYQNIQVRNDLQKAISNSDVKEIDKVLPSTRTLDILLKKITKRAQLWADDAYIENINLYIEYDKTWQIPTLQVYFYSAWKKELAIFYEGSHMSESFEELQDTPKKLGEKAFFELNKEWQKEIIKAFNSVSTRVNDNYKIRIHQMNPPSIVINYNEGRVKKEKRFDLEGNFILKK